MGSARGVGRAISGDGAALGPRYRYGRGEAQTGGEACGLEDAFEGGFERGQL